MLFDAPDSQVTSLSATQPEVPFETTSFDPRGDAASVNGIGAEFNLNLPWPDLDPVAPGFQLTFSYSNFLDGQLPGGLTPDELRAATEEALGLWASVAPLHFQEVVDSGPPPDGINEDIDYPSLDHPNLRIGHHSLGFALAHAYYPVYSDGLAGDVHFNIAYNWTVTSSPGYYDVLEVMTHELGHSLGLDHEEVLEAIMNPIYADRFSGPGTGFLLQDDINGVQALYGIGVGSVTPLQPLLVDTLADENDGDYSEGNFSLREAIEVSIAGGGLQGVGFDESLVNGTIELDSPLMIDGSILIQGLGSDLLTVQAKNSDAGPGSGFSVFSIDDSVPEIFSEVTISGLTLTGGNSATDGGAIFSVEDLVIEDLQILDSATLGSGGAIYSTGSLTVLDSTIKGNTAGDDGGGLYTLGGVTLTSSTVSGNSSSDDGGGIAIAGEGTKIVVSSSTISGNNAGDDGGGIHSLDLNPAKLQVNHSTVTNNTAVDTAGGIYVLDGVLVLDHSIVAENTDGDGAPDVDNINFLASPVVLVKQSLIGDGSGADFDLLDSGSQIGTALFPIDPMLDPMLADNGGPTKTHALLEGSPAIDSGDPLVPFPPEFDQRGEGFPRIRAGIIDLGAFESNGFPHGSPGDNFRIVSTLDDEIDGDFSDGDFSLREALWLSGNEPGFDTITFKNTLDGGIISLNAALGELAITSAMQIDASDLPNGLTIDASGADPSPTLDNGDGIRLVRIDDGSAATTISVEIVGIAFTGGDVTGDGGAIFSTEDLTLRTVSVLDSSAIGNGGGIYHKDGFLYIGNSTVANNRAILDVAYPLTTGDGGGLWTNTYMPHPYDPNPDPVDPVPARVFQSTFSGNVADDEGGGLFNFDGPLAIEYATITNNQADWGSGVVSYGDLTTQTTLSSTIVAGNIGLEVQQSRNSGVNSFVSDGYNLIGFGNAILNFDIDDVNPDQVEVLDPQLDPLADNGGKTLTHALRNGSPAVDMGDPTLIQGETVSEFDQRGFPFNRINEGFLGDDQIIDIGAFEKETTKPDADFDKSGRVDGFDFLAWQRGFGTTSEATPAEGDADRDGDVDKVDLGLWQDAYGTTFPEPTPVEGHAEAALATSVSPLPIRKPEIPVSAPTAPAPSDSTGKYEAKVADALAAQYHFYSDLSSVRESHGRAFVLRQTVIDKISSNLGVSEIDTHSFEARFRRSQASLATRTTPTGQSELGATLDSIDTAFERLDHFTLRGWRGN